jgi:hypothetical protein
MTEDHEWQIVRSTFRCGGELQSLLKYLKENCNELEYRHYSLGIASAIDALDTQLTTRVVKARPDFRDRIDRELAKYGRIQ